MAFFVTFFSLLYVYQQSEIIRLAYAGQKQRMVFQDLLDKNSVLRYNIERSASLVSIGSNISGNSDFQMPDKYQLVKLTPTSEGVALTSAENSGGSEIISRILGLNRRAEAKTISP